MESALFEVEEINYDNISRDYYSNISSDFEYFFFWR